MVFQDFRLFSDKTAYENIACVMRAVGTPGAEIRRRVPALLRTVSMESREKHFPRQLSGGEQQRIALARAIANNPDIIIADEPTGNIDPKMSIDIMNMLMRINKLLGKTVIVVTLEESLVDTMGQRIITIKDGKLVSDKPAVEVSDE
jgi:cell division transport system ATP-binding protein